PAWRAVHCAVRPAPVIRKVRAAQYVAPPLVAQDQRSILHAAGAGELQSMTHQRLQLRSKRSTSPKRPSRVLSCAPPAPAAAASAAAPAILDATPPRSAPRREFGGSLSRSGCR